MSSRNLPTVRSSAAVVGTVAALGLALAGSASAHVRVVPDTAEAGSYATLTFKVPTESDTASTTKLEVDLPTDHPFGSISTQPVPGWNAKVTNGKLPKPVKTDDGTITDAPTKITWTADSGQGIKPGEFQQFVISAGPVPDTGQLMFKAHQTYSDGKVVNWDEPMKDGAEPENPAPVLYVNDTPPADSHGHGHSHGPSAAASPSAQTDAQNASKSDSAEAGHDNAARWMGLGGIVVGALGLLAGVYAATRKKA